MSSSTRKKTSRPFRTRTGRKGLHGRPGKRRRKDEKPSGTGQRAPHKYSGSGPRKNSKPAKRRPRYAERHGRSNNKVQKVISSAGLASRRKADDMVKRGQVTIDGSVATLGERVPKDAEIMVCGKPLPALPTGKPRLLIYNKPTGQVVSRSGMNQVFEHLPRLETGRWVNVGRLDINSEGLLLFTDNGDLANHLAHPSSGICRKYVIRSRNFISDGVIESSVRNGVSISGEIVRPISFVRKKHRDTSNHWYEIELGQGRNRVVRRLFESFGADVSRLIRVQFGEISLPKNLKKSQWLEINLPKRYENYKRDL